MYSVKHRFYKERLKFYIENEVFSYKTVFSGKKRIFYSKILFQIRRIYRKSGCIVKKTPFLQGKTEILHRKRGVFLQNGLFWKKTDFLQ